ncbi:MAG TPA: ABC transporter ATP-binding protein [Marmoricola sp.]|nr:ABC transporter ATP-binding protein [Marmoricola sp.]
MTLLEVRNLVTRYPVRRSLPDSLRRRPRRFARAVDGISFDVQAGQMLALVGESGCGKTTTAQSLLRMVEPTAGSIRLEGRDITHLGQRELRPLRRTMQMVYQDPYESLDPRFRARQTVEEPMLVHGIGSGRAGRRELVNDLLERVGLTPPDLYAERYPHQMSGGQRQRLAIAASLVLNPRLLVTDEPVSMLDVSVRAGVLELLDSLRREETMGVLMITHDLSTAAHFADEIAVMYLGRIVERGPARQVVRDPRHPYTQALLSVVPARDPRRRTTPQILQGEAPDPVNVPPGCRFAPRCPYATDACRAEDPALADVDAASGHQVACIRADELFATRRSEVMTP